MVFSFLTSCSEALLLFVVRSAAHADVTRAANQSVYPEVKGAKLRHTVSSFFLKTFQNMEKADTFKKSRRIKTVGVSSNLTVYLLQSEQQTWPRVFLLVPLDTVRVFVPPLLL